ncbi:site-2 protease family protein [Jannaschia donghaensis]|uniref:Stage IV sporulation protein FB n=1 Tax=Jannaschia donghaensis TaxID=420998 RepID=A0A0M6YFL2_9RHOB|nr:site-2 protease family protein [Jannaschia donghaensis]CTQ48293.1 Stage IV sporulation protein FB [Jannaschia donghaensis]
MFARTEAPIFAFRGPMGIPVEVAPSFAMLAFVFLMIDTSVDGIVFFALIAGSIFLHELGHAWGCRVQGVGVSRIVMWGGGGLCYHRPEPDPRRDELIVIAGPLVNLALWAIASLASGYFFEAGPRSDMAYELASLLGSLAWINLILFALNMLPVSPLDGGRLFYLVLRRVLPMQDAGRVAGVVGTIMAIAWIPAMFYLFVTYGVLLFFMPSISQHVAMARGRALP